MVAALYCRKDSIYNTLGVDVYDIDRDARTFNNTCAVVAHPPCRSWGRLRAFANPRPDEKELAIHAVNVVRNCGGVLEHPGSSSLWQEMKLPLPGAPADMYNGFSLSIDQHWFGHKAKKRTWLYIVGCSPKQIPAYPISLNAVEYSIGLFSGLKKGSYIKKEISKKEREATPDHLARWLIDLAEICDTNKKLLINH